MKKIPLAKQTGTGGGGGGTPPANPPARKPPTGDVQLDNPPPPKKEGQPDPSADPPSRNEPGTDNHSKLEKLKAEQDTRLDALFAGDDPPPPGNQPPKPKEEPPPPPKPKEEPPPAPKPDEKKKEGEGEEEGEINFDKPPEGSEEQNRESIAQQQARENGQKLKALETEHQETKNELERVKGELELLRKGGAGQPNYREEDFARHPEVVGIRRDIINDRNAVAQTQAYPEAGKVINSKFGDYMTQFIASQAEGDVSASQAIDAELRKSIGDDFRNAFKEAHGDNYNEQEMETEARQFTREVLQLLVRNAGKTQEIQEKITTLAGKAREGLLAQGVEVYQHHETDIGTAINAIPEIPEAVIAENPHTVEATVAVLLQQPAWKKRFEETRKQVLETLLGPKVLTQKDLETMQAAGVDAREFSKARQKKWLENRRKLAVSITQSLLLRGLWEQTSRKAASFEESGNELDALSRGKPKDADPPPPKPQPRKAGEFRSAIEDHLEEVERR